MYIKFYLYPYNTFLFVQYIFTLHYDDDNDDDDEDELFLWYG